MKTAKFVGARSKLSSAVRALGYSESPLLLDEWLKLRQTILSMSTDGGLKRVHLPPVIVSCAQCGKVVTKTAFEMRKHMKRGLKNFYCSILCLGRGVNVTRFGERVCVRCGEPAPRRASFGTAQTGRIFCSKACIAADQQEQYEQRVLERLRPCERCNAMFAPTYKERFCSKACASRAHAGRMAGRGNPRWLDGVSASRVQPHVTRRFRELRPMVIKRDGGRCLLCESSARLEVHHIDENALNNRVVNLATLCKPCHKLVHFSPEKQTLSSRLKTLAEQPLSTTSRWKAHTASSRTESSPTTA